MAALNVMQAPTTRHAVVTGANKGIGFETVRQLSKAGVTVVLTARNEKRGIEATNLLHESGLSNVVFHPLDVRDPTSIECLAKFVAREFERLDILVNNAGASGVLVDEDALRALNIDPAEWLAGKAVNVVQDVIKTTYEKAQECLDTNYYGVKNVTEALLPSLQLSTSGARIVNVSSLRSELRRIPNEQIREELGDIETLTEDKIDKILQNFLCDLQEDAIEVNGWQKMLPAYSISKATLNAFTRVLAKKYPKMYINCVHPGYVNTDINWHTGTMTVEEGAEGPVMLALLPDGGHTVVTGANKGIGLEAVWKLANDGVTAVLTSRREEWNRSHKMLEESGLANVILYQLDVRGPKNIESLAKFISTEFRRLDMLVNNAAVLGVVVN